MMVAALIALSTLVATPAHALDKFDAPNRDSSVASAEVTTTNIDVWRLYNPYSREHLFTVDRGEYDRLGSSGWQQEGMAWVAPSHSSTPVYRLYNPYTTDHHYTTSRGEYDSLRQAGWSGEGTGWYSDDAKRVPVYRVYNPYEKGAGSHLFTTSLSESMQLRMGGWEDEEIGWYGIEAGQPAAPAPNPGGDTGGTNPGGGSGGSGETNPGSGGGSQPSNPVAEPYYWINTNSHIIHGDSCPALSRANLSKPHWKKVMTPAEAAAYLAQGYTKCKDCRPTGI